MDGDYIHRNEHEEFAKRMTSEHERLEDENNRQNKRLYTLESTVAQIAAINTSVEKLATNMENMLNEQYHRERGWRHWRAGTARCGGKQSVTLSPP